MPAAISVVIPQAIQAPQPQQNFGFQQPQSQPVVFVNSPQSYQPRLKAGGWFSRSFASTSGVLLAMFALLVGVPLVVMAVFCGGCFVVTDSAVKGIAKAEKEATAIGVKQARTALSQYGVTGTISTDARRSFCIQPGCTDEVTGSVRTPQGVKTFVVQFHVATFDNKQTWSTKRVIVADETLYEAP